MQTTGEQFVSQRARTVVRDEAYRGILEQAKLQARRYAALETPEGRLAAVAVLRFARSLRPRQVH